MIPRTPGGKSTEPRQPLSRFAATHIGYRQQPRQGEVQDDDEDSEPEPNVALKIYDFNRKKGGSRRRGRTQQHADAELAALRAVANSAHDGRRFCVALMEHFDFSKHTVLVLPLARSNLLQMLVEDDEGPAQTRVALLPRVIQSLIGRVGKKPSHLSQTDQVGRVQARKVSKQGTKGQTSVDRPTRESLCDIL